MQSKLPTINQKEKTTPELSDIRPYLQKKELIRQTAQQIIKDFNFFGEDLTLKNESEITYSELINQIIPIVGTLFKYDHHKLLNLLYRIDLSEKEIAKRSADNTDGDISVIISELIIERELKKVIIRNYFSGNIRNT